MTVSSEPINVGAYPSSIDYRNHAIISPVKNQASCGSCWSFATAGYLESLYLQEGQGLKDVSEQQMMECAL